MFFVHYKDSGIVRAKNESSSSYNQEIEVVHRENELLIRHHFTNLSSKRLEINWPKASEHRTCHVADAESCSRLNEETTAFVEGDATAQSISYVIPKEEVVSEEVFWQSVFAEIHKATPEATVLHVIDEVNADGMWVTGLPQVGNQTLNLVNYTLFSGRGPVADLYWQKQQLPSHSNEYVTVYGADTTEFIEPFEELFIRLKAHHAVIVLGKQDQNIASNRFMVTDRTKLNDALQQFMVKQFYMNTEASSIDQFTAEVMTGLLLGDAGAVLSLAPNAVNELKESLTTDQITQFVEMFESAEELERAEDVDKLIEEITGYKTSFFTKNSQLEEGLYPFLLENPKKIVVLDDITLESHALVQDEQNYYPIRQVMEALAYTTTVTDSSLYIENKERQYRFPLKEHFYVLNERRVNTQSTPVKQVNADFYVEEATMLRIFQLTIEAREQEIRLTPVAGKKVSGN